MFFASYAGLFSHLLSVLHDPIPMKWFILVSSYIGTHKNGEPHVSLDIAATRLILLDRVPVNDPETEQIPF